MDSGQPHIMTEISTTPIALTLPSAPPQWRHRGIRTVHISEDGIKKDEAAKEQAGKTSWTLEGEICG